ncbi:MAG: hypothetical protein K6E51_05985 [Treponema sp.]|nr:hypothetical protein [Treponema sp.]
MNYYCTLFDSNYLTRGLALYNSLVAVGEEFTLYAFAFDDVCFDILEHLQLPSLHPISLVEFESDRLLRIKKTRTRGEYCWTCSCFSILHVLTKYKVPEVTYLDSDLYFFSKPSILLDEFHDSGKDVLITRHRYTPEYDQSKTSGVYCVQFMTFKNTYKGLEVLNWWCDRCDEWCYNRMEDGKFGDQKYLDDWMTRFDCCHELEHIGGGVAPWNVQQYELRQGPTVNNQPVIFYHFHGLKWHAFHTYNPHGGYRLDENVKHLLYTPYVLALQEALLFVRTHLDKSFNLGFTPKEQHSLMYYIKLLIKLIIRYHVPQKKPLWKV